MHKTWPLISIFHQNSNQQEKGVFFSYNLYDVIKINNTSVRMLQFLFIAKSGTLTEQDGGDLVTDLI